MRLPLKEMLEKLAVDRILYPYETQPWIFFDPDKATTCNAEVRMGPDSRDIEVEVQMLRDPGEDDEEDEDSGSSGGIEQVLLMRAEPSSATGEWSMKRMYVRKENYVNKFSEWDVKGCNFFRACVQAIKMNSLPDIDDLIDKELQDDDFFGGRRGRIGRKSPNVKPGQLLGINKRGM